MTGARVCPSLYQTGNASCIRGDSLLVRLRKQAVFRRACCGMAFAPSPAVMASLLTRPRLHGIAVVIFSFLVTLAGLKTNITLFEVLVKSLTPPVGSPAPAPTTRPVNV